MGMHVDTAKIPGMRDVELQAQTGLYRVLMQLHNTQTMSWGGVEGCTGLGPFDVANLQVQYSGSALPGFTI